MHHGSPNVPAIQPQLKTPYGQKTMKVKSNQTKRPLPLFIISHSYLLKYCSLKTYRNFKLLLAPCECTSLYLTRPPTSQEMLPSFTCSIRLLAAQQARCAWSSTDVEQGHNLSVTAVVAGWLGNSVAKKPTLIPQPSPPNSYSTSTASTNQYRRGVHGLKSCMKQSILRFWFPSCT